MQLVVHTCIVSGKQGKKKCESVDTFIFQRKRQTHKRILATSPAVVETEIDYLVAPEKESERSALLYTHVSLPCHGTGRTPIRRSVSEVYGAWHLHSLSVSRSALKPLRQPAIFTAVTLRFAMICSAGADRLSPRSWPERKLLTSPVPLLQQKRRGAKFKDRHCDHHLHPAPQMPLVKSWMTPAFTSFSRNSFSLEMLCVQDSLMADILIFS